MCYNRYKPWRKTIELDEATISLAASMGWVELFRGEYFFTEEGNEGLRRAMEILKENHADVRS